MRRKQSGLTMISWIVVLGFLAVQAIMVMRIVPVYMSYNTLKSVMDTMKVSTDVKGKSARVISEMFRKKLKINNLYDLAASKDAFKFKKIDGGYSIIAHYEERGPIYANLEFVATFDYSVDVKTQ